MDAVAAAFEAVPRTGFLPRLARGRASYDGPIGIGRGQTNSQPRTVADMLRLLDVVPGQRVLDVGAGSGWTTALLAHLVGPSGEVLGVELEPDLVRFGAENLARTEQPWASIRQAGEGVLGWPDAAPYDRILVSAEPLHPPRRAGRPGRPTGVGWSSPSTAPCCLVVRRGDDLEVTRHGGYRFVPLR